MTKRKPETFAARLRALRARAGLSVAQLAKKAGVNRTYLHNLEAGLRGPSLQLALKLARALGTSLSSFDDISD